MNFRLLASFHIATCAFSIATAAPFSVKEGVFNQDATDLGLSRAPGSQTITVFTPTASSDHYGNGVVMIGFKGKLYCQWQSSAVDEDAADTWVAYSIGTVDKFANGSQIETWSTPRELAPTMQNGIRTSGGWNVFNDTLIAFINVWPDSMNPRGGFAYYRESADGITWGELKPVLMKDGKHMAAIIEQDPHEYDGRLYNAAHFQPGLLANPIYTDDLSGRTGWVKAKYMNMEHSGTNSREMEPSLFQNSDGEIVMTFRDQNSTYYRLASVSKDRGATWSTTELTNMPDSRAKQSAGNLPDGSVYLVGNPVTNKTRIPLSITLSNDGKVFDRAYNLRTQSELPDRVYEGQYKSIGYHYPKTMRYSDYLYVSYSTNKELVEYTRIPLTEICDYEPATETPDSSDTDTATTQAADSSATIPADSSSAQQTDATFVQKQTIRNLPANTGRFYDVQGRIHRKKATIGELLYKK